MAVAIKTTKQLEEALLERKKKKRLPRKLKKAPRTEPSIGPEAAQFRELAANVDRIRAAIRSKLSALVKAAGKRSDNERQDADALSKVISGIRVAIASRSRLRDLAKRTAKKTAAAGKRDLDRVVSSVLGLRPDLDSPKIVSLIQQHAKENAELVTKASLDFVERLEKRVRLSVAKGTRPEDLEKVIARDFVAKEGLEAGIARRRAKLIARDQQAKLRSQITEARQTQLGVRRYVWRTAVDERVRSSHRSHEGEIFEWGKPMKPQLRKKGLTVDTIDGHPGAPINCRCYAEPVLADLVDDLPEIETKPALSKRAVSRLVKGGVPDRNLDYLRTGLRDLAPFLAAFKGLNANAVATGRIATANSRSRFEPIKILAQVLRGGKTEFVLTDGRHRLTAARRSKALKIAADITVAVEQEDGSFVEQEPKRRQISIPR